MRILLTGATGLIGTQLGIELARRGHELTVLSRKGNARDLCFPARCLAWDHINALPESVLFGGRDTYDVVIHLAGESVSQRWTSAVKKNIYESRIKSTKALIETFALKKSFPKVWINASAIGIYGDAGEAPLTESSKSATGFLPSVCTDWERCLESLPDSTRVVALRLGVVFSNEGGALPQLSRPFVYGFGGPIGDGKAFLSWIHIDDVVRAIIFAIETATLSGPVNLVGPNPVSNKELTTELAKTLKMPAILPVPKLLLRLILGEMGSIVLASARVLPEKLLKAGFKFTYPQISSALSNLLSYCQPRGTRLFTARQWIEGSPEEHFPFFSAAENLETITPPWLNFKILKKSTDKIHEGTLIDYKLKIKGLPIRWRTRIENWNPPTRFVDTQLRGPYKTWHHTHTFEKLGNGTLMTDKVLYRMHVWPCGDLALPMVKNDVKTIFNYRRQVIEKVLNSRMPRI